MQRAANEKQLVDTKREDTGIDVVALAPVYSFMQFPNRVWSLHATSHYARRRTGTRCDEATVVVHFPFCDSVWSVS